MQVFLHHQRLILCPFLNLVNNKTDNSVMTLTVHALTLSDPMIPFVITVSTMSMLVELWSNTPQYMSEHNLPPNNIFTIYVATVSCIESCVCLAICFYQNKMYNRHVWIMHMFEQKM